MDPLSLVITGVLAAPAQAITVLSRSRSNMDLTTIEAEHNGVPVVYAYQLWRVKAPTVCARYQQDIAVYSRCTVAAQDLFYDACQHFKPLKTKDHAHRKAAEMYCDAANTYQPTLARVEATGNVAAVDEARAACNAAVAAMMGSSHGGLKAEKEKACSRYHALRDGKAK